MSRQGAHVGLGQPGLDHRVARAALVGGAQARAVVAQVVEVGPEHDRRAHGAGQRLERVHQRRLAVVTTIAVVGHITFAVELVGDDLPPSQTPLARQRRAVVTLAGSERR